MWVRKSPVMKAMVEGAPVAEFCESVAPVDGELVVVKQYASGFGTSLRGDAAQRGVNTVILAGCSTSGCIRATAEDAVRHGFRAIVVREHVGDRHPAPQEANVFDIDSKYGDVVSKKEAIAAITSQRTPRNAAISFRIAGHSETIALAIAAVLAGVAAAASAARLYHPAVRDQ